MQEVEKGAPGRGWCAIGLAVLALAGPAAAQSAPAPAPAPAADNRRIDVSEYIVRGNTVLDARTIETALLPFSGPARTQADLESAARRAARGVPGEGLPVGVRGPARAVR